MKKEFTKFRSLLRRNVKMYFADKTIFLVSLMAPLILLLLFVLFLRGVYVNSFNNMLPEGFAFSVENITGSFIAGWLLASLMAVTCVTVSIGACIIMVQDKINGVLRDLQASPVKSGTISLAYFAATFASALIIQLVILCLGFIYIAISGWYLSFSDVLLIFICTLMLTLFGCGLAVIINTFVKSDGGVTAVSALSASVYGFICGAYMPLSQFGAVFSNIFGFNPGLYGSILFKNLFLRGTVEQMSAELPDEAINSFKDGFDMNFYFFGAKVPIWAMWLILGLSVITLCGIVALLSKKRRFAKNKNKHVIV